MAKLFKRVMVTGGAGYVGSNLVPKLLAAGYGVTVLDLYIYGDDIFSAYGDNPDLREVKGDLRSAGTVADALTGCDAVIHLACISNDPSFDLDPGLGKSINYDCFRPLVKAAKDAGVRRFIYASSSSVYGIKAGAESNGGSAAAAFDGLFKIQGAVRGRVERRGRARIYNGNAAACDHLRLCAAVASRSYGQHPYQSRGQ